MEYLIYISILIITILSALSLFKFSGKSEKSKEYTVGKDYDWELSHIDDTMLVAMHTWYSSMEDPKAEKISRELKARGLKNESNSNVNMWSRND